MRLARFLSGSAVEVDASSLLGSGGEARVYGVRQEPGLVAKVYHQPTPERARKLTAMLANPPDDPMRAQGHASIAWPVDLLCAQGNRNDIVGFLMPRVVGMSSIIDFYNPKTRLKICPVFNYLYLHRAARNLATAFGALHARGYVVGDVNESNILVKDTALVTLVDTDSFQVREPSTGSIYRCTVGKAEYTPPDLQGKSFSQLDRTTEHDLFGLGVVIFQLLMEGTHPFAGVFHGVGDAPALEDRIRAGHFPHGRFRVPYGPISLAPPFEVLHPELQQLAVRCFEDGHRDPTARPDALAWRNALGVAEAALIACRANDQHRFGNHLPACPWCERTTKMRGFDAFPSSAQIRSQAAPAKPHLQAPLPAASLPHVTPRRPAPIAPPTSPSPMTGPRPPVPSNVATAATSVSPVRSRVATVRLGLVAGSLLLVLLAIAYAFVFRLPTGTLLGKCGAGVEALAYTKDGASIVSANENEHGDDYTLRLWNIAAGREVRKFGGDAKYISCLALSPDGQTLASGGRDKLITLWNIQTGQSRVLGKCDGFVYCLAFSPDGKQLASGDNVQDPLRGAIRLWSIETGKSQFLLGSHFVCAVIFTADGKRLISGGTASIPERNDVGGVIYVWDAQTGRTLDRKTLEHMNVVRSLALSPDGSKIACGLSNSPPILLDLLDGNILRPFSVSPSSDVRSENIAFAPNGRHLATGSWGDQAVRIWDITTGQYWVLGYSSASVQSVAFSPSGDTLAVGDNSNEIRLWQVSAN